MLSARALREPDQLAQRLSDALATRSTIERARDHLMTTMRVTADEAFDTLRKPGSDERRMDQAIAADLVDQTGDEREDG